MDHAERITLAQIAYEAYSVSTGGKDYRGLPLTSWDDLREPIRAAWAAAATAVVNTHRGDWEA